MSKKEGDKQEMKLFNSLVFVWVNCTALNEWPHSVMINTST